MKKMIIGMQPSLKRVEVALSSGLLFQPCTLEEMRRLGSRFALFCDETVAAALGKRWQAHLEKGGLDVTLFTFPPGEEEKSRERKAALEDLLLERKFGRDACLIALGGGVTTDLIGFLASTYCRGVPLILAPTTLLAMVDAAIGGKTAVNTPFGKNLIGTFYPAERILLDPATLSSLPTSQWTNGLAEIIKYALISSPELFQILRNWKQTDSIPKAPGKLVPGRVKAPRLADRKSVNIRNMNRLTIGQPRDFDATWDQLSRGFGYSYLEMVIQECILIKGRVVEIDFEEKLGYRRILNFGHTIAHGLEWVENYRLSHGEAVAIGMLVESFLSVRMGYLPATTLSEIEELITSFPFALKISPNVTLARMQEALLLDKKNRQGSIRFVLLEKIGACASFHNEYCCSIPQEILEEGLNWMFSLCARGQK